MNCHETMACCVCSRSLTGPCKLVPAWGKVYCPRHGEGDGTRFCRTCRVPCVEGGVRSYCDASFLQCAACHSCALLLPSEMERLRTVVIDFAFAVLDMRLGVIPRIVAATPTEMRAMCLSGGQAPSCLGLNYQGSKVVLRYGETEAVALLVLMHEVAHIWLRENGRCAGLPHATLEALCDACSCALLEHMLQIGLPSVLEATHPAEDRGRFRRPTAAGAIAKCGEAFQDTVSRHAGGNMAGFLRTVQATFRPRAYDAIRTACLRPSATSPT